ncbi:hypothetical protein [Immundisolibacter sp.]
MASYKLGKHMQPYPMTYEPEEVSIPELPDNGASFDTVVFLSSKPQTQSNMSCYAQLEIGAIVEYLLSLFSKI